MRQPRLSTSDDILIRMLGTTDRLSRGGRLALSGGAVVLAISFDLLSGGLVNAGPVYMLSVCIMSWLLGAWPGIGAAAIATLMTATQSGGAWSQLDPGPVVSAWNAGARFAALCLVAVIVSGLNAALRFERWRASTDGLTGALNKVTFLASLERELKGARRRGDAVILGYIDLDGFKGVNDRFGHAAGDSLLTDFADAAARAIRASDLFGRMGGDEFALLLTVPDCGQAERVAHMLHERLSAILHATELGVSCSTGALIADARQPFLDQEMIGIADTLMYEAKRAGKNAIRIARADLQVPDDAAPATADRPVRRGEERRLPRKELA